MLASQPQAGLPDHDAHESWGIPRKALPVPGSALARDEVGSGFAACQGFSASHAHAFEKASGLRIERFVLCSLGDVDHARRTDDIELLCLVLPTHAGHGRAHGLLLQLGPVNPGDGGHESLVFL